MPATRKSSALPAVSQPPHVRHELAIDVLNDATDRIGGDVAMLAKLSQAWRAFDPGGRDPRLDERFWVGLEEMTKRVLKDLDLIHKAGQAFEEGGAR